jgi:hypothetical protein
VAHLRYLMFAARGVLYLYRYELLGTSCGLI